MSPRPRGPAHLREGGECGWAARLGQPLWTFAQRPAPGPGGLRSSHTLWEVARRLGPRGKAAAGRPAGLGLARLSPRPRQWPRVRAGHGRGGLGLGPRASVPASPAGWEGALPPSSAGPPAAPWPPARPLLARAILLQPHRGRARTWTQRRFLPRVGPRLPPACVLLLRMCSCCPSNHTNSASCLQLTPRVSGTGAGGPR